MIPNLLAQTEATADGSNSLFTISPELINKVYEMVLANGLNVIVAILIFGLGLDLTGAALASVAARLVIA